MSRTVEFRDPPNMVISLTPRAPPLSTRNRAFLLSYVVTKGSRFAACEFVGASWRSKTRVQGGRVLGGPKCFFFHFARPSPSPLFRRNRAVFFWRRALIMIRGAFLPEEIRNDRTPIARQGLNALLAMVTLTFLTYTCESRNFL